MPDLERILQATPGTLSQQWYEGGVAVNPGTVTIGISRADGTVLVAAGTATGGTLTAARTFNLTTAHTVLLDRWTVTWTSSAKGTLVSYVEVVGGFLFTLAEAEADTDISANADIASARVMAEQAFEKKCKVAFVPRYERETVSGRGTDLRLKWREIRTIRAASMDDVALTAGQVAEVVPWGTGLYWSSGWRRGRLNVTVDYEHGYDYPPAEVSRAVLRLAKHYLTDSPTDDRMIRLDTDVGSYTMAIPGRAGSEFGIPEVDAVAERYALKRLVA